MSNRSKDSLSPEMIRLLKIFGIGSFLFVLAMSFFNEKKANNSGKEVSELSITDADRIFFRNMRALYYDREGRTDAKMSIYRHGKRKQVEQGPYLNLAILLNQVKDEAYIFLEPYPETLPLHVRWENADGSQADSISFTGGDKFAHYRFVQQLLNPIMNERELQMWHGGQWVSILQEKREKEALKVTLEDFFKLINQPLSNGSSEN